MLKNSQNIYVLNSGHVPHVGHDHSHGHGKKKNKHGHSEQEQVDSSNNGENTQPVEVTVVDVSNSPTNNVQTAPGGDSNHSHKHSHSHNLNMLGVFIHIAGDFLGSLGVIFTAIILLVFPNSSWTVYIDPSVSIFLALIILISAVPLVIASSKTLVQGVPKGVSISQIKEKVLALEGVLGVHEIHVWQVCLFM